MTLGKWNWSCNLSKYLIHGRRKCTHGENVA